MTPLDSIYYRGTDLWPALAGKRVFVAGSAGFFGRWFVAALNDLKLRGVAVEFVGGSRAGGWDLNNPRTYSAFQLEADYVINCAGWAIGGSKEDLLLQHVIGPVNLCNHLHDGATMLQFSSGAARSPKTQYARVKLGAEQQLQIMGRPLQIVRPFAVIGPGMPLGTPFAIPTFIQRRLAGQSLEVRPGLTRSFCHIADLIVQCFHVMLAGDGQPYEVGSDDPITVEAAARLISDDVRLVDHEFVTNAGMDTYVADLSRVKSQFNLSLDWTSEQAVVETWRSFA